MVSQNSQPFNLRFGILLAFAVTILAAKTICTTTVSYHRITHTVGTDRFGLLHSTDSNGIGIVVLRQLPKLPKSEQCQKDSTKTSQYELIDSSGRRYHAFGDQSGEALDLIELYEKGTASYFNLSTCLSAIANYLPFKIETSTDGDGNKFFELKLGHLDFSSFLDGLFDDHQQIRTQQALDGYLKKQGYILVPWGQAKKSSSQQMILEYFTVEVDFEKMTMNVTKNVDSEVKFVGNGTNLTVYVPSDPKPTSEDNTVLIVCLSVGGAVLVFVVIVVIVFCCKRNEKERHNSENRNNYFAAIEDPESLHEIAV